MARRALVKRYEYVMALYCDGELTLEERNDLDEAIKDAVRSILKRRRKWSLHGLSGGIPTWTFRPRR